MGKSVIFLWSKVFNCSNFWRRKLSEMAAEVSRKQKTAHINIPNIPSVEKKKWKIQVNQRSVKVYSNVQTCVSSEVESGWWLLSNNNNNNKNNNHTPPTATAEKKAPFIKNLSVCIKESAPPV